MNPCRSNPCRNGKCQPIIEDDRLYYRCRCKQPGFDPKKDCMASCPPGSWGLNCRHRCGACEDAVSTGCSVKTGCRSCWPGWKSAPFCNIVVDASKACLFGGTLISGDKCRCVPWRRGVACELAVDPAELRQMEMLQNITRCDMETTQRVCGQHGTCYYNERNDTVCRCAGSYLPPNCASNECLDGSENCLRGRCRDGTCNCRPGWQPPTCSVPCSRNTWGQGCEKDCGNCAELPCLPANGLCNDAGCQKGWMGERCEHPEAKRISGQRDRTVVAANMNLRSAQGTVASVRRYTGDIQQHIGKALRMRSNKSRESKPLPPNSQVKIQKLALFEFGQSSSVRRQSSAPGVPTRRQASSGEDVVVKVDFTVAFNPVDVVGVELSKEVVSALRASAGGLQIEGWRIDPRSIQVVRVYGQPGAATEQAGGSSTSALVTPVVVFGVVIIAVLVASVIMYKVVIKKPANHRSHVIGKQHHVTQGKGRLAKGDKGHRKRSDRPPHRMSIV